MTVCEITWLLCVVTSFEMVLSIEQKRKRSPLQETNHGLQSDSLLFNQMQEVPERFKHDLHFINSGFFVREDSQY